LKPPETMQSLAISNVGNKSMMFKSSALGA